MSGTASDDPNKKTNIFYKKCRKFLQNKDLRHLNVFLFGRAIQGFSIQSHLPQKKHAGELAPMRFRRLPGVTGPCPSTTLDKSFIHFEHNCSKQCAICQQKNEKRRPRGSAPLPRKGGRQRPWGSAPPPRQGSSSLGTRSANAYACVCGYRGGME